MTLWVKGRPTIPHLGNFRPFEWYSKIDPRWQSYVHYILQGLLDTCSPFRNFMEIIYILPPQISLMSFIFIHNIVFRIHILFVLAIFFPHQKLPDQDLKSVVFLKGIRTEGHMPLLASQKDWSPAKQPPNNRMHFSLFSSALYLFVLTHATNSLQYLLKMTLILPPQTSILCFIFIHNTVFLIQIFFVLA